MEIALLPIAAVLLLLSGAGAPAHALGQKSPTAALMRHFFGANGPSEDQLTTARIMRRGPSLARPNRSGPKPLGLAVCNIGYPAGAAPYAQASPSTSNGLNRKHYRTRFGFANGAYNALAPPLA